MSQKQKHIEESENNQKDGWKPGSNPRQSQARSSRNSQLKLPKLSLQKHVDRPAEVTQEIQKDQPLENEIKEFHKDLYDDALKNRAIIKSLKKYRPSNSSLVVGYKDRQNIESFVKLQSRRNGMTTPRVRNQPIVQPSKFAANIDILADVMNNLSHLSTSRPSITRVPQNKKDTIRKIILGYEHNLKQVRDMLKQEREMEVTLTNDFTKIGQACGLIQESFHLKGMSCFDVKQFKREIRQLSIRCQVMTRSIRKR